MATQSSIFAWRIPWTEEPGHYNPWSCKDTTEWLTYKRHRYTMTCYQGHYKCLLSVLLLETQSYSPIPHFFNGRRGVTWSGSSWGHKESDTTERLSHFTLAQAGCSLQGVTSNLALGTFTLENRFLNCDSILTLAKRIGEKGKSQFLFTEAQIKIVCLKNLHTRKKSRYFSMVVPQSDTNKCFYC